MDYDIFISYARENFNWVNDQLYMPLLNCYTKDMRRPDIFMDKEEIGVGSSYIIKISNALQTAKIFIPVFSDFYFNKDMTIWELNTFFPRDPNGTKGLIAPILIQSEAEKSIPHYAKQLQFLDTKTLDWMDRLIRAIGFVRVNSTKTSKLVFVNQPSDVILNLTMPEIVVEIQTQDSHNSDSEVITVEAEKGDLHGSCSKSTENGRVHFSDLFFTTKTPKTSLIANCEGYVSAYSKPFSVIEQIAPPLITEKELGGKKIIAIPCKAEEIIFFDNGKSFISFEKENLTVYDITGIKLSEIPYIGIIKIIKRQGALFAVAMWSGDIILIRDNGEFQSYSAGVPSLGFNIPGDLTFYKGKTYVGFCRGIIFSLSSSNSLEREFFHDGGVQKLAVSQENFFICDYSGKLNIYKEKTLQNSFRLEPLIHCLKVSGDNVFAIGEKNIYQIAAKSGELIVEPHPIPAITYVLGDVDLIVVMDKNGKGIRYNKNLNIRSRFHTLSSAIPVSADNKGMICIFRYPDNSKSLMIDSRIVYNHKNGILAISPQGKNIIMGDAGVIKIYDDSILAELKN